MAESYEPMFFNLIYIEEAISICNSNIKMINDETDKIKNNPEYGSQELVSAACKGDFQKVQQLVNEGHSVDSKCSGNTTALSSACHNNFVDIILFLLGNGANPNIQNITGITPLISSGLYSNPIVIQELLNKGAVISHQDNSKQNALHTACVYRKNIDGIKLLISNDTINAIDKWNQTPLDIFYEMQEMELNPEPRHDQILQLLLQHGAKTSKELSA